MAATLDKSKSGADTKTPSLNLEALQQALLLEQKFYVEENARLESTLKKLNLLPQSLHQEAQTVLDQLCSLQEKYGSKDYRPEAIMVSSTEQLRKRNTYVTKVKNCIKVYNVLIDKLSKDIKASERELKWAEKKTSSITTISDDEFKSLLAKTERYEKELLKLEKRNPWLVDPRYRIQSISKEADILSNLQREKEKLKEELNAYKGLKPDIYEASQQLAEIKQQYNSMK